MYEDERDDLKRKAKEITDRLTSELLKRGIEPPRGHGMWWDDSEDHGGTIEEIEAATGFYLTDKGEAAARRLIREDKRKNIEWWVNRCFDHGPVGCIDRSYCASEKITTDNGYYRVGV